jgi:hypothetical protein
MTEVRIATVDDVKDIFKLLVEMSSVSDIAKFTFCPEKVMSKVCSLIKSPDAITLIAVEDKVIIGVLAGVLSSMWFTSDRCAMDHYFYITEKKRGSGVARLLVERFLAWAKNNASHVAMGVSSGAGASAEHLFQSLEMSYVGGNFIKHF